jgi:anaerobic selenocysteine-containing dehydrogenase
MNQALRDIASTVRLGASACPHDCPSTCALEVEILDPRSIGRIRGAEDNDYTAGVVCAKVARYAERLHHKDRLLTPLRRKGGKGSGEFVPVSWDDALDITAEALLRAEARHGAQSVGPTTMPAPWASSCVTASIGCATPRSIRAFIRPFASIRPIAALPPGSARWQGPIRAKWRNPT